jgi:hypothetical protein
VVSSIVDIVCGKADKYSTRIGILISHGILDDTRMC